MIITELTTTQRGLSLHIEVEATPETGLDGTSYIQCELSRSINSNRLAHRPGAVGPDTSNRVTTVIKALLNY